MGKTKNTPQWVETIRNAVVKHSDKIEFNEFEHTYTLKRTGKILTPVSDALSFFHKGLDDIPTEILEKAKQRGTIIHKVAEFATELIMLNETFKDVEIFDYANTIDGYDEIEHSSYVIELIEALKSQINLGYELICVETPIYNAKASLSGTPDAVLARKIGNNAIEINVFDWKTGKIRIENTAQVSLYSQMLKDALKSLKMENKTAFIYNTTVVSLKDKEIDRLSFQKGKND